MGEKIDPTWLAFSFARAPSSERLGAGIARLKDHYGPLVDYPLEAQSAVGGGQGVLVIGDADPRCRWPFFAEDEDMAVTYAYVPSGFGKATEISEPSPKAALALGAVLVRDPRATRHLAPPFAIAVLDKRTGELLVVNDWIGAGRCLEVAFPEGKLWTNRAAAAHLFAGREARADPAAWRILAGAGWFMGRSTPIEGVEGVETGLALRASGGKVDRRDLGVLPSLIASRSSYEELRDRAAEDAVSQIRLADALWEGRTSVDLSGGRDSRVVAAAALAAGSDAEVVTSDRTIGEADVALELMSRASGRLKHSLRKTDNEAARLDRPLLERALNVHLLHDGMRHPQKVRGNQDLPRKRPQRATLSGHGGAIAKGFYYPNRRELWRVRLSGNEERIKRVSKLFPKVRGLARGPCADAAREAAQATLDAADDAGLSGPERLEWFYLCDRFAHRQGLASHAERLVLFAMPAFVEASFAMSPKDRMASRLHEDLVARFVPEWAAVSFFDPDEGSGSPTRRRKLWESPDDAAAIDALVTTDGVWTELYQPDAMRTAWAKLKAGEGNQKWEAAFEGAVYRQAFEDFLERVNAIARSRS
ncbi:MAG: hypothetical protein M3355_07875 [Actinomycetota bacterium]|nr:hypothetical protein [Actinomycetota bacterium]